MAVDERQMDFRHHQCGLVRQCLHERISAIDRFNDLTPDLLQQLPVQPRVSSSGSTNRIRLAIRPSSWSRVFTDTPLRSLKQPTSPPASPHGNGVLGPRIAAR
jgi:hypothetical protein